ncbi:MAG: type I restriction-modification system subunit M [Ktedonobacteraceae bacterium]
MNNFSEKVSFIWSVADLIRDTFKRSKYQDVILPLTVLRRIDCVLQPTKPRVLATNEKLKGKLDNLAPQLCKASGYAFYNTSLYDFERLLSDAPHLATNLRAYINGFSDNMREVLEKFDFNNTIAKLEEAGLLFLVLEKFKNIDLHPDVVSNLEMGYIFEELIRKFNEALNENPGEHFTPREVIRLMVNLLLVQDQDILQHSHIVRTVYDPCCGSGGMLTIAKDRILEINPLAEVHLFGQELNGETFAISKSDLYMKSADGRDADNIKFGSTLSKDQHAEKHFDYLLTNPPYGKEWKMDQAAVEAEAERGYAGRFGAGTPRISDGQLLFLQHLLARMQDLEKGGSRLAIVMNGSPLFTGDAGSGESEIRRWILENDWLEAIVALPEQLFYNTGISTYIWVLTNRKEPQRQGKVQLIDATNSWVQMRKSLGNKRREISKEHMKRITETSLSFAEAEHARIFDATDFGYRKITIERPLRLNFQASPERLASLPQQKAFIDLATSKKKHAQERSREESSGKEQQQAILSLLAVLPGILFKDRAAFENVLDKAAKTSSLKLSPAIRKAILSALSERDETAEVCRDKDGNPEPDPELRDTENIPLKEDIWTFFEREVKPHVPDAWINTAMRDHKDGGIGKVGYEINFNRYFYTYQPPRPLEEIEADIKLLERDILAMLREVAG